ncbi:putative oxidoreductase [Pseudooceanicola nitratireducens]|jgi:putative oxidoreductase|uniref:Putative oxidoreductase n=1 Tax=Pseudooceanicola nitratireducens TaxID=517719 RepID=A0A1I1NV51_9RHOB|nr:DoxX family protein [Pseudooceanicola nitratireducens]SEI67058.1 putative oxidoreductase [Pseudooceanicola nitratireducens]SFC99388.1 putative oxidoreductase [Pseudooceanicola nitratireducens]
MTNLTAYAAPLGRVLLSFMFILSGLQKITGYAGTQGYMEMMGVPGALLPIVILVEVVGGIALLIGWQAQIAAFLLAGFSFVSGFLFHFLPSLGMEGMAAQGEMIGFMKNLTIAGGMLMVVAFGPGTLSVGKKPAAVPAE